MAILRLRIFWCCSRFAGLLGEAVGLDWLMLFLQPSLHTDTVSRALRILVLLLSSDRRLLARFQEGDIFGQWVKGFERLTPEMLSMLETSVTQLNPLKSSQSQFPLPGTAILSHLLPHHLHSAQVFLLLVAFLLGCGVQDIPFSAPFDMETLDNIFDIGNPARMATTQICPDAAFILLAMARVMLHQVCGRVVCVCVWVVSVCGGRCGGG